MTNTNYFSGIVKILESPKDYLFKQQINAITIQVELPQKRKSSIITLLIWGNLGRDIKKFYNINDYILIEGYSSIRSQNSLKSNKNELKKVFITVRKIYPILLTVHRSTNKIPKKAI